MANFYRVVDSERFIALGRSSSGTEFVATWYSRQKSLDILTVNKSTHPVVDSYLCSTLEIAQIVVDAVKGDAKNGAEHYVLETDS